MPGFDFRAANIQTRQIIATGSFDESGIAPSQIAIYPIEAQGTPVNQGEIESGLFGHLQSQDVFLYVSGAIGGKNASTKGITVFGGDIHVSGNMSIDGSGGGGGAYSGSFPFRPTVSDFDTPIISGTITGGVALSIVSGSTLGSLYDFIQITATDPQAGAVCQIPIIMPVTPLPDKFGLELVMFTGAPPSNNFQAGLAFNDASGDRFWEILHSVETTTTSRPVVKLLDIDSFVINSTWDFPSSSVGNALHLQGSVEKVSPFAATPQIRFDITAGGLSVGTSKVIGSAFPFNKTSGSISAGWTGQDFVGAQIVLVFLNTMIGDVDLFLGLEFLPHFKDLI